LERDGDVGAAMPNGIIRGAGSSSSACKGFKSGKASRAMEYQWHLDLMAAPEAGVLDVSDMVVAVIDTGVAYETYSDNSGDYAPVPSLSGSAIVAPWDFVNNDGHANDDHQHGTHIASSIASAGSVEGVASGAALMPLKVLDENNAGTELYLIEAIHHAVDEGADVINMSLSFDLRYMPSPAMLEALERAADYDIVMVAAAGNNGADVISYPAASPLVLAVGATDASGDGVAPYSNRSNRVDVLAPGGQMDADLNGDGLADGVVAETINPADPTETGLWMYAGTSQAAALVSGAVVNMLAMGALPEEIGPALEWAAWKQNHKVGGYDQGAGAGLINAEASGEATCRGEASKYMPRDLGAAVLPYLIDNGDGTVTPTARVTVVDFDDGKLKKDDVYVTLSGTQSANLSCELDKTGICTVEGDAFTPGSNGELFIFEVNAIVDGGIIDRPKAMIFASDAFEVITAAVQMEGDLDGALLGFSWEESTDADLGDLAAGVTVMNMGTGLASSPLGFVVTMNALPTANTSRSLDLDGTGLASSPLGFVSIGKYSFNGSGLASSPLGFANFSLITFSGSGLASSPLGFHSLSLASTGVVYGSIDGSGLASSPLGFTRDAINLSSGSLLGGSGAGSAIEAQLDMGGWGDAQESEQVATTFGGSGLASSPLGFTSYGNGSLFSL
jgi:hypothetical protein